MLDLGDATKVSDLWQNMDSQAALPATPEDFFGKAGPKRSDEQRAYERHYLRCQAILRRECETHAIYMKDCSRTGMGLISPVQLFPRERVQLWMSQQSSYSLEVTRCRRIRPKCYECGTIFILK